MKVFSNTFLLITFIISTAATENWNQWRGPNADGISTETDLPLTWGPDENILWKKELAGKGSSVPIIWEEKIFLTGQIGSGPVAGYGRESIPPRRGDEEVSFTVQCFNKNDGSLIWEDRFVSDEDRPSVHPMHNLASPSCVTDGEHVIAWFATGQIHCYDMAGNKIWSRNIAEEYYPFQLMWAHGSSPVLNGKYLYLLCDHDPAAYLLALDKSTGEELWKAERGKSLRSYSTPLLIDTGSRKELIVSSNPRIDAHNPETGELLWNADEYIRVPVPMPVFHNGILYTTRGYRNGPYMAIRPGGNGDVSKTHILWRIPTGAPYVSSLLYYKDLIYMSSEEGNILCVDPKSGEPVWNKRFSTPFWASPVGADGKIYFLNEDGETIVMEPGDVPKVIATNALNERCTASPAISDGKIYIRSEQTLFCIGK